VLQDINFISHWSSSLTTSAPPLTVDNVLTAVQGVDWRTLGEVILPTSLAIDDAGEVVTNLEGIGQQCKSNNDGLHVVVMTWVQGDRRHKERSWRQLIWELDGGKMPGVADKIRHFAEPVLGKSCDSISVSTFLYRYVLSYIR